ncbi:O-antigen ligase family protein, partial [Klebsiella pneumoniae]|nr:O-antigen ligase family protein [Klebsiella pneumoniae]
AAMSSKEDFRFNVSFFCFLNILYLILSNMFPVNSRNTVNSLGRTLNDSRLSLWEDSITSLLANPWIGYGINGVRSSKLFSDQNFQVTYV